MNQTAKAFEAGKRGYRVRIPFGSSHGTLNVSSTGAGGAAASSATISRHKIVVPQVLHKFVIGSRGGTLSSIQYETNARIIVPSKHDKCDFIEVEGSSKEVLMAEQRIQHIVNANIQKVPFTHFISLPISDVGVQRRVGDFQKAVQQELPTVAERLSMTNPAQLHITAGMLRLITPEQVAKAVEMLKSLQAEVCGLLDDKPLVIKLGQLAAMEASLSQARTIYVHARELDESSSEKLLQLCAMVRGVFDKEGYFDEKRPFKIHVTIFRSKWTKQGLLGECKRGSGGVVDATSLFKSHGELSFGACRIDQIQIAKRFWFTESGAYVSEGSIALP
ncbi:activating signal cointegrator 1 complex subunit [Coemansia thaxteri]|uniref:Activating signal cointegrator 1 complex subunit n=1 Tax=Coemansia thaxteri TaxID=2663907 RepID=A0A9W8EI82_9FUNG|nr:activating signal cointegrator 1 complex subunit [Coemansia thaxteri]KAJ2004253.1 activating signal cointegrator 1 complex subunit [Coemansia thaxteri]KAJ2471193.1 activating signal cointegrator 1 complex subunit [Coemansia sp. RSA 2322]KAJ2486341.1 activating signal cointegrator 1 complex subunit [Coemansia sp. RSA 2320]